MRKEKTVIKKHALKKGMSLILVAAMLLTGVPDTAVRANNPEPRSTGEPEKLCELTFDDASDPLAAGNAVAVAPASYGLADHDGGKALSLDGSSQYLSLTAADGSSLLTGKEEFTISYDINNLRNGTNWAFYAAKNDTSPSWGSEYYLGCLYSPNMSVERYCNGRTAPASGTVAAPYEGGWHHYDVVVHEDATRIFKDGILTATTPFSKKISEVLGDNSIFNIGKANWGSGEFCQAEIDNFVIYDGIISSHADSIIADVKENLTIPASVKEDIVLPARKMGADISWESSDTSVITNDGIVTRGAEDAKATLTATITCGSYDAIDTKVFDVTVAKEESIDDYLVGSYNFDDNIKNMCDESGTDEAQVFGKAFAEYTGEIVYETGIKGKAVRVGNYGFDLNKKNLGTDFTVSMWVKPDGTFLENDVMLFLGYHNPEKWIGVSGNKNGTSTLKIWGKGDNLTTWTTLFTPQMNAGTWHQLVITGTDGVIASYLDGAKVGEDTRSNNPLVGENQDILLALNNWDNQFKGLIDNVKVYSTQLTASQVQDSYNQMLVENAVTDFTLNETEQLKRDITLPAETETGVKISWKTSDASVITDAGVITRGDDDGKAVLTASFTSGNVTMTKEFNITVAALNVKLCELTFEDTDNPLSAGNALAAAPASYSIVEHDGGKALSLDGSSQYLSLTAADGSSLLTGKEEFTISYDINNLRNSTNWSFFAAKSNEAPTYQKEYYLGCLYSPNMSVERYCNGRTAPASGTVAAPYAGGWHHYDVVVHEDGTRIYTDGVLTATTPVSKKISEVLGDNSIFNIGKATWGGGEFCKAEIDNFIIYDGIKSSLTDSIVSDVSESLTVPETVKEDIELPVKKLGADISWESSNPSVITDAGSVTRGMDDEQVKLTATISSGDFGKIETKVFDVTVPKDDGVSIDDFLVGEYAFDGNAKNACDETGSDEASVYGKSFAAYTGEVQYEEGIKGDAVRVGNYGFELNKKNLGTDFTVSMWVKPDGAFPENQVMLFLGYHNPEKWIGVSGNNGSSTLKIWGNGGSLTTWTTLFTPQMNAGTWHQLVLTGTDGILTAYMDGVKVGEDNRSNNPLSGENQDIYIAVNNWDAQCRGLIDDVKVYSTPLTAKQVKNSYNEMIVEDAIAHFALENTEQLRESITLPSETDNNVQISWATSDDAVITAEGVITRNEAEGAAVLTATFTLGNVTMTKDINVTVAAVNDEADVNEAKELLSIQTFAAEDIALPDTGAYDTSVVWSSSDEELMDGKGKIGSKRPQAGEGNATVTLTATITKGNSTATKDFEVTIMEQPYGYILGYIRGNNDRTGSLHIAYSTDRSTFTVLNGNAGILFAKNDTSDGNKTLSTGVRFDGIGLYRNSDGSFGMIAPQGKDNTSLYVYNSADLLSYTGGQLITSGMEGYENYSSLYKSLKADTNGLTIPEGALNCSILAVTKAEYDNILQRFNVVTNEGITLGTEEITVETEADVEAALPKTATASYSDGSKAALNIKWDTDKINMNKAGTYTLTGSITPYSNPLIEQRADPQIKYDEEKDCYYFTASYPAFYSADNGYDRIVLRKADSIQELSDDNGGADKEITIWEAPDLGKMARHVWAPELQKVNGKWYVFFAAGNSDNIWAIRPYVLVCQNNDDPYNADNWKTEDGSYEIHAATSRDSRYFKNMSLDMTYFEHNGKHYVIWADIIGQSALYMQEIDPEQPWVGISDKVIMLTTPEFGWERDTERVNEGPTILKHDGRIFCAFSASGAGPGILYRYALC